MSEGKKKQDPDEGQDVNVWDQGVLRKKTVMPLVAEVLMQWRAPNLDAMHFGKKHRGALASSGTHHWGVGGVDYQ